MGKLVIAMYRLANTITSNVLSSSSYGLCGLTKVIQGQNVKAFNGKYNNQKKLFYVTHCTQQTTSESTQRVQTSERVRTTGLYHQGYQSHRVE